MLSKLRNLLFILISFSLFLACNFSDNPTPHSEKKNVKKESTFKENTPIDTLQLLTNLIHKNFPDHELSHHQPLTEDINNDQEFDLVALTSRVCTDDDETATDDSYCYTVIIFFNEGDGKFRIAATNNYLVECSDCGGAGVGNPHQGIKFEKGILSFESLYGACDKTNQFINFSYDELEKKWWLDSIETSDYSCRDTGDGETTASYAIKNKKDFGSVQFMDFRH